MLRPASEHLGSTPTQPQTLSPPPFAFGTSHPSTVNATDMISSHKTRKILKKPKRPLTAYHIYFQIEREFIIQTMAGEDADKSIHEGKIFFHDVPKRYINIKLSPDWYFGPGKRAKRKHRKQHGKIGFLELSRVITSRWAKLEETDPDIKQFVSKLAKQEYEEYKRELKGYREYRENRIVPAIISKSKSSRSVIKQQSAPRIHQHVALTMPHHQMIEFQQTPPRKLTSSFPFYSYGANQPNEGTSFVNNPVQLHQEVDRLQNDYEYSYQPRTLMWGKPLPKDGFDHCMPLIDNNIKECLEPEQHPCSNRRDSTTASPLSVLDPLIIFDHKGGHTSTHDHDEPNAAKSLRVNHSDTLKFVDICDEDIFSMWNSTNSESVSC